MQWFLSEYFNIYVDVSTISRRLAQAKWTKTRLQLIASQRCEALRSYHLYIMGEYTAEQLVFVDESGLDRRDGVRRTGWSPKGVQPTATAPLEQGLRFYLLPTLTTDSILDLLVYQGSTDREGFLLWLEAKLLPKMQPYPAKHSVLVMDNASWHHGPDFERLRDEFNVRIVYLPPYSPDFNPIEAYFSDVKAAVRRHYQYKLDQWHSNEEFGDFLVDIAHEVGSNVEAVRGHFRNARVSDA